MPNDPKPNNSNGQHSSPKGLNHVEQIDIRSLRHLTGHLGGLIRQRLWLQVLVALFLGIGVGILMSPTVGWLSPDFANTVGNWVALPGKIFLGIIQMIVIPLVFASIIRGLAASENVDQLKRLGVRSLMFFVVTTAIATTLGVGLALLIKPGNFVDPDTVRTSLGEASDSAATTSTASQPLPDTLVGLLPKNPLGAMVNHEMLQIVIFSAIVGTALISLPPSQSKPLLDLLGSLQEVCMAIVKWAMRLAPLAVFGLIAQLTTQVGLGALLGLSVYVLTVLAGLLLMLLVYVALVAWLGGIGPWTFLKDAREVQLLAFSTSSSAAVMPLTIQTAEKTLGVRSSIAQFVVPLGATVNMGGTALYQGVATIFLAQIFGVEIGIGGLVLLVVTAVAASIGSPATPGVGIVILAMVLSTVNVPTSGLALILGVDRILDMSRTAINVTGDLAAARVLEHHAPREAAAVTSST